jgi:uncharacterized protein YjbI with pentapeptide repeats
MPVPQPILMGLCPSVGGPNAHQTHAVTSPSPHQSQHQAQSLEGQDLRGKTFIGSWRNTNFCHITTGTAPRWHTLLLAFGLLLAFLAGFITAYAGNTLGYMLRQSQTDLVWLEGAIGLILLSFFSLSLWQGLTAALGMISVATVFLIVTTVALAPPPIAGLTVLGTLVISGAIAGIVGLAQAIVLWRSPPFPLGTALVGLGAGIGVSPGFEVTGNHHLEILGFSLPVLGLAWFIGHRALRQDDRYEFLTRIALNLCLRYSTNFRDVDLTGADFSGAKLHNTDFRGANLSRTHWRNATFGRNNLDRTYLEQDQIRHLVTTGAGQGQTFDHLDLRGINLNNAQLAGASFIGTDLSGATLQNADLTNAKLSRTQLYGANLTGAILTGAYIQDWGISPETQLDQVQCGHIYMRQPTATNPYACRKPDNEGETFSPGDFAAFIAPMIKTLSFYQAQNLDPKTIAVIPKTIDLYHRDGLDPKAAAISLQRLMNQHPDAQIEVVTIEGRGQEKIRLQAKVAPDANPAELNKAYFASYNQISGLAYADLQQLLDSSRLKDEEIARLERLLRDAINTPHFYAETYQNRGDTMPGRSQVNVSAQGDMTVSGILNLGTISGTVTNTINQLPANPQQPGLRELLGEFQRAIETDEHLPEEDKAESLQQLQTLAEVSQQPQAPESRSLAKRAIRFLQGTAATLPEATKLVQACTALLPEITALLPK